MSKAEVTTVKDIISSLDINPTYLEHEPCITSEDAARMRGFELKQGVKALLFGNGEEWVIVDVPADKRVNQKKVATAMGWSNSKTKMASSKQVLEQTGCKIGAVPPFGHKHDLPLLVDEGVFDNQENGFNIGLRTHSVKISTTDLKKIFIHLKATEGEFT